MNGYSLLDPENAALTAIPIAIPMPIQSPRLSVIVPTTTPPSMPKIMPYTIQLLDFFLLLSSGVSFSSMLSSLRTRPHMRIRRTTEIT